MQLKRLILLIAIATLLSIFLIFPTHAVGEEGTGILYVYTDPERTTLATTDAEGRYVVIPGVEYYFTVSGITEYNVDTSITIWVYRTNTAENIEVGNFEVNSVPFDAIFTWTIPEDWLEEPIKVKYGTNLENDWLYAQGEIWVNYIVGTGILYVYEDSARTIEAPQDERGNYLVLPETTYYFSITGITEYENTEIKVWASYWDPPPFWKFTNIQVEGEFDVGSKPSTIEFDWTIPALPIDTILRFKYGKKPDWPSPDWFFAAKPMKYIFSLPRKLFVIPEVSLGPMGALIALFSGFKVATFLQRKKQ